MVDIDRLINYALQSFYHSIMFQHKPHNDELMELNHCESKYPDKIELMTHNNEKLKF